MVYEYYTNIPRQPVVHFRLKPEDQNGFSVIYLQFVYHKRRLFFSFGQTIRPSDWNEKKQRVKNKLATTDGKFSLNDLLDHLERICLKTYSEMLKDGIPEPEVLKEAMKRFINKNHEFEEEGVVAKPTLFSLTERFINGEIKFRGRNKSESSLKNYHAVAKHLKEYQQYSKKSLDFEDIDLNFFYAYTSFLEKKGLGVNTIAKDISIIKVFMGEAVDLGYTNNMIFRHKKFSYSEKETEQIYLTEAELDQIYKVQITSKKLDRVRDLFLVGA